MPIRYEIYEDLNLVLIIFEGVLTVAEVLEFVDKLDRNPLYHETIDELGDFRTLTEIGFDASAMQNLNDMIFGLYVRSNRRKRVAQIAPFEPGLTIARAYAEVMKRSSGLRVGIFDAPGPAISFLGHRDTGLAPMLEIDPAKLTLRPD